MAINTKNMKITILLLLASICSYGQIDTTTVNNENFNLKSLDSFPKGLVMSEDEFKLLRFTTQEELENQFWDEKKQILSKLIGDYIKEETPEEKNLIGFYKWLTKK